MSFGYSGADVCDLIDGGGADGCGTLAHDVVVQVLARERKLLGVVVSLGDNKDVMNGGKSVRCDGRQTGACAVALGRVLHDEPFECFVEDGAEGIETGRRRTFLMGDALEEMLGLNLCKVDGPCQRQRLTKFSAVSQER